MDAELARFKTGIDLRQFAETCGYILDKAKSSLAANPPVYVIRNAGDKLIVTRGRAGWIYRNERNHADQGDIIQFVRNREGLGLGEARKRLRAYTGNSSFHPAHANPDKSAYVPVCPADSEPDRAKVRAVWNAARWEPGHSYLMSRHVPPAVLSDPRFFDTYRISNRGNVLFPHSDRGGLCGYEWRGPGVKRFGSNCKKGLWLSANIKTALRIVICEAPIDALSFQALHGNDAADQAWPLGYAAFGGGLGRRQIDLLSGLCTKAADRGAAAIIGTDSDPAGDQYAELLQAISPVTLERMVPVGKDWNCDLSWCQREAGGGQWN